MKKFAFIMAPLLCLTVMFFTACSNTNKASSSVAANKAQTSKVESNASDKPSPALSGMDVFAIWKNDIAACNNDENIYIVSRTQIGKIDKQGKVSVLSKGLLKGNDIALHNNYIYFIDGIKLCHIDKDGKNKYTFNQDSLFKHGISTIYIKGDVMYFTAKSDAQSTTNTHTYWSNISKDQETITWNTGTKDLEYKNYQTSNGIISALGSGFSNFNLEKVSFPISFTNDYLYYFETGERLMRMNKKTGESEKVLIKSSVYDKTTIIQNWIYYWNDGYLCRTTENYSKTEKLMESPLISQKELEGLN